MREPLWDSRCQIFIGAQDYAWKKRGETWNNFSNIFQSNTIHQQVSFRKGEKRSLFSVGKYHNCIFSEGGCCAMAPRPQAFILSKFNHKYGRVKPNPSLSIKHTTYATSYHGPSLFSIIKYFLLPLSLSLPFSINLLRRYVRRLGSFHCAWNWTVTNGHKKREIEIKTISGSGR